MNSHLDFRIGDISFVLDAPEPWLSSIRSKWHAWCEPSSGPKMSVQFETDGTLRSPTGPLFETLPECNNGECVMQTAGFSAKVSVTDASAQIRLHPDASIVDAVYFLRVATAAWAFHNGAILFHSATVVHHHRAYAFFGLSGSGKTTAAKLSDPDPVLSDDLVLVHPRQSHVDVYSTPFSKVRGDIQTAPLAALLRLIKAPDVALVPISSAQALGELVANSPVISGDPGYLPQLMRRWQNVMALVPAKALHFRREPSFWEVIDAELG